VGYDDLFVALLLIVRTSNVESLKQGFIKTSKNEVEAPYTILLVGETGVGKSAFLEFIINVVIGNTIDHYNFNILNRANEQGGSATQSQTNSAHFYERRSKSGLLVSASVLNLVNRHNP
jgi:septin family protein